MSIDIKAHRKLDTITKQKLKKDGSLISYRQKSNKASEYLNSGMRMAESILKTHTEISEDLSLIEKLGRDSQIASSIH